MSLRSKPDPTDSKMLLDEDNREATLKLSHDWNLPHVRVVNLLIRAMVRAEPEITTRKAPRIEVDERTITTRRPIRREWSL